VESQTVAPAVVPENRRLFWCLRREIWENRSIYIAPLAVAAVFLIGFLISSIRWAVRIRSGQSVPGAYDLLWPFNFAGLALMGITTFAGVFYCVEALHGERRDRSILFWKSLPVSDFTTVLAKAAIPILVLPLLGFVITVFMHWIMLLITAALLAGTGLIHAGYLGHLSLPHLWLILLYHLVAIHGIWFAPFYGWLLLVSAWARRVPFLWAVLPPAAIGLVEKIAFNTTHFGSMLRRYVMAAPEGATFPPTEASMHMAHLDVGQFLISPGLWMGLAITAVFMAGAVRLRRYRGPI
jgi:ABC-2 type transport system permease protein